MTTSLNNAIQMRMQTKNMNKKDTDKLMNVREKIKARLDTLEADLKAGKHLQSDEAKAEVETLLESASKFYSVLSDGDRDFLNAARHAMDNNMPWT